MFFGAGSCVFFAHGSFYYEHGTGLLYNILAIILLCIADILDCTDGQLARMSGKKSQMGRILDGMAGFIWFIPIYVSIVYRFFIHHDLEFQWLGIDNTNENTIIATIIVVIIALISGVAGMAGQQRLADYYIQVHLFFLKGEKGSELDNSAKQRQLFEQLSWKDNFIEKLFLKTYVGYTLKQEAVTPQFQRMMAVLQEKYGSMDNIPSSIRERIHANSLSLMKWNGLLTFNFRSAWFFLFCLLDIPVMNFIFEILAMGLLYKYVNHRHESFCKEIADTYQTRKNEVDKTAT